MLATRENHRGIVEDLLRAGASRDKKNKYGDTALSYADHYRIKDMLEGKMPSLRRPSAAERSKLNAGETTGTRKKPKEDVDDSKDKHGVKQDLSSEIADISEDSINNRFEENFLHQFTDMIVDEVVDLPTHIPEIKIPIQTKIDAPIESQESNEGAQTNTHVEQTPKKSSSSSSTAARTTAKKAAPSTVQKGKKADPDDFSASVPSNIFGVEQTPKKSSSSSSTAARATAKKAAPSTARKGKKADHDAEQAS